MREKLVRDGVPALFGETAASPGHRIAEPDEMMALLLAKLREETDELEQDPTIEELADILEVVHALAPQIGSTVESVEAARHAKATERGGFAERIVWTIAGEG